MTPPDLAVQAGSAIPEQMVGMAVVFAIIVTTFARQSSTWFWAGLALTAIAWFALLLVVAHGRYVTEAVAAGEYGKGPFRDRNRGTESIPHDTDEQEGENERGGGRE